MFAGLMGHLGKAKARLESDTDKQVIEKRKSAEVHASQRQREDQVKKAGQEKVAQREKKARELEARDAISVKQKQAELALARAIWLKHERRLGGFLRTEFEPRLRWAPKDRKSAGPKLTTLMEQQQQQLETLAAERKRAAEKTVEELREQLLEKRRKREEGEFGGGRMSGVVEKNAAVTGSEDAGEEADREGGEMGGDGDDGGSDEHGGDDDGGVDDGGGGSGGGDVDMSVDDEATPLR
jgi:hypothetical protein